MGKHRQMFISCYKAKKETNTGEDFQHSVLETATVTPAPISTFENFLDIKVRPTKCGHSY